MSALQSVILMNNENQKVTEENIDESFIHHIIK